MRATGECFHLEVLKRERVNRRMSWTEEGHGSLLCGDLESVPFSSLLGPQLSHMYSLDFSFLTGKMKALGW